MEICYIVILQNSLELRGSQKLLSKIRVKKGNQNVTPILNSNQRQAVVHELLRIQHITLVNFLVEIKGALIAMRSENLECVMRFTSNSVLTEDGFLMAKEFFFQPSSTFIWAVMFTKEIYGRTHRFGKLLKTKGHGLVNLFET